MNEAATTWALVVGVDKYDYPRLRQLEGAVGDAIAAVRWLRAIGVPAEQILLHASPSPASEQPLKALLAELGRPTYLAATENGIWASIDQLRNRSGSRLFVFLAGHGLYDPETRRMFLPQDAGVAGAWLNLGLDEYLKLFLSMDFPAQFVFVDGCQNYPYSDSTRPTVQAGMHQGVTGYTARPGNRLAVCYAASQDQRAAEIEGRGAFLRRLLPAMDPTDPYLRAVDLDFPTGQRTFDLWKLMHEFVIPTVERDAASLVPAVVQRPAIEVGGAGAAAGGTVPVYRLPDVPTSEIVLEVQPPAAGEAVESVRVADVDKPFWDLFVEGAAGAPVPNPLVLRMPKGRRARAECRVRQDAPWDLQTATWDLDTSLDQVRPFTLAPRVAPPLSDDGSPPGPLVERFAVETYGPDGRLQSAVDYAHVAARLGLPGEPSTGSEVAPGVRIIKHETGPEFDVDPDALATGRRVVAEWSDAVRATVNPALAVLATVRGDEEPDLPANLRVLLPEGGAAALAGALADLPAVSIGRGSPSPEPAWRTGNGRTLADLERAPAMRVDPGPVHIRVDLPWGSWTEVVSAPSTGEVTVSVPAVIGTPPLRVQLESLADRNWTVLGAPADTGRVGGTASRSLAGRGRRLVSTSATPARWALQVPETIGAGDRTPIVTLTGERRIRFPIRAGWPLAVERRAGGVRVEPLSAMTVPEWDLLVGSGRLDLLTREQADALTNQKWFDEILGLAGAYAVYAARDWEYLGVVVQNLRYLPHAGLDVDLLDIALTHRKPGRLGGAAVARLERAADEGDVPVLRWGIPLARALLKRAGSRKGLSTWRREINAIARGLSPISVWTAWTEPVRRAPRTR